MNAAYLKQLAKLVQFFFLSWTVEAIFPGIYSAFNLNLHRELGCLQTIQIRPANSKEDQQIFDYVIIIDFESTCWDGAEKSLKLPEVIEFPAVLMNTSTGSVESEFQQYVMPMENPHLSDFCKKFTGISQDQVENGVPIATCLRLFSQWIKTISSEKTLVFHKNERLFKSCTFVTWSGKCWVLNSKFQISCTYKWILN